MEPVLQMDFPWEENFIGPGPRAYLGGPTPKNDAWRCGYESTGTEVTLVSILYVYIYDRYSS